MAKKKRTELAEVLARAKITDESVRAQLKQLGFKDRDLINDALIVAAVFHAAASGDLKAVEKWAELTESVEKPIPENDAIDELMQARAAKGRPGAVRERRNSG